MIEFRNVSKVYDNGTVALKNVNLRIDRGEFVFVVGASGAGKSTFLKTIMREEVPSSGTIMINNYDLTRMTKKEIPYYRRTLGIVFQDFRLIQNMTVYDNVAFAMRVIGASEKEIRKRVPYVLSLVGLQDKARSLPNEISGGEQQRVALARALVNNANTIIADEPTGNVDPEMSYEIVDLLNRINENGTTVIMVTHEHELVKQFDHRIVVIDNGQVVSDMPGSGSGAINYHPGSRHAAPAPSGRASAPSGARTPASSGRTPAQPAQKPRSGSVTMKTITLDASAITAADKTPSSQTASAVSAAQKASSEVPEKKIQPNQKTAAEPQPEERSKMQEAETSFDPSVYIKEQEPGTIITKTINLDDLTEDATKPAFDYEKYFEDLSESLKKGGTDNG